MVCLGFKPGTANGRRRQNHRAMVAAPNLIKSSETEDQPCSDPLPYAK